MIAIGSLTCDHRSDGQRQGDLVDLKVMVGEIATN
jgi:hypothetical protein